MAKLKINELKATGTELFEDSETFLNELSSDELVNAVGGYGFYSPMGRRPTFVPPTRTIVAPTRTIFPTRTGTPVIL